MRKPSQKARERILDAALPLIHERGYRDVSMDDLAEAAGLKKANLFYYYPTKDQLGLAALERAIAARREEVRDRFSRSTGDPIRIVERMFLEVADGMKKSGCTKGCLVGNLAQELSDVDERFREKLVGYFDFWAGEIADMLERARKGGYFAKELHAREAAESLLAMFEGATTLCKARKDPAPLFGAAKVAAEYLEGYKA